MSPTPATPIWTAPRLVSLQNADRARGGTNNSNVESAFFYGTYRWPASPG